MRPSDSLIALPFRIRGPQEVLTAAAAVIGKQHDSRVSSSLGSREGPAAVSGPNRNGSTTFVREPFCGGPFRT